MYLINVVETLSHGTISIDLRWLTKTRTCLKDVNWMKMCRMFSTFKVHPIHNYIYLHNKSKVQCYCNYFCWVMQIFLSCTLKVYKFFT